MTSSYKDPEPTDVDIAKFTLLRQTFKEKIPDHPLANASDIDFQAALASATPFSAESGPIAALQAWLESMPEVTAFFAVAAKIGPVVTVVSFLWGQYTAWQQEKRDKEMAKKIIREIVVAGNSKCGSSLKTQPLTLE